MTDILPHESDANLAIPPVADAPKGPLFAPYPWAGGKSVAAPLVWDRFGDPSVYIEPFFGSGAVLFGAPGWQSRLELINDKDAHITNFWRAVKYDAELVAKIIRDTPPDECELEARNAWLKRNYDELGKKLRADHLYYHAEMAAMWCWGVPQWLGEGWGDPGNTKKRQIPSPGKGVHGLDIRSGTLEKLVGLRKRLSNVVICNGDWERLLSTAFLTKKRVAAVFLDPPYTVSADLYTGGEDKGLLARVESFCEEVTSRPNIKVALCGYAGTMKIPAGWEEVQWTSPGGMNNHSEGNTNRFKERIWFSPSCNRASAGGLDLG